MAYPSYIDAFNSRMLHEKVKASQKMLEECKICPRMCGIDRQKNQIGFCRTGKKAVVCSYFAHHGEEPAISGSHGSGAIFFSRCNMKCVYCQNFDFSQLEEGREVKDEELASYMIGLQNKGCHNINLITPTHVMPQILNALLIAVDQGLCIPLIYNTSGYECPETIAFLEGIIDIYLPDARYASDTFSARYSEAPSYPKMNQRSLKEMFRQTGPAEFDENEIIKKGLIVRHLVLPNDIAGTEEIFSFITHEVSPHTYVSLMSQYFPAYRAENYPTLDRPITWEEYEKAIELMKKYGLENGWIQESGGLKRFAGTNIKRNV